MSQSTESVLNALGVDPSLSATWGPSLDGAFSQFQITTNTQIAGFLGQILTETGSFKWLRELWGPTTQQKRYERDFSAAWPPTPSDRTNVVAFSLGNSEQGDGFLFRGAGLIQITGRTNFQAMSTALNHDFISSPTDLATPQFAALSACQYWVSHKLGALADAYNWQGVTRGVNGGLTAYQERLNFTQQALQFLNAQVTP